MSVIWKFEIGVDAGCQQVEMPDGAEILSVGLQGKDLVLWALVDPARIKTRRWIEVLFTGDFKLDAAHRRFIGSVQHEGAIGRLVWHVFEREVG